MPRNKKKPHPYPACHSGVECSRTIFWFSGVSLRGMPVQKTPSFASPAHARFAKVFSFAGCSRLLVLSYTVRDAKGVIRWRGGDFSAWPLHWHYFTKFGLVHASVQMDTKTEFASVSIQNQPFLVEIAQQIPPKVCALHQQKVTNLCLLTRVKQTRVG